MTGIFGKKPPIVRLFNFTIKCDGERTCFEYKTEEEAKSDRQILADAIYEFMDEHPAN